METKKKILICPLDWGLGHAARCVPIIESLLLQGHQVIIGADRHPLAFLKQAFPALPTLVIPGYEVNYDEQGSSLKLFYESVKFYGFIKREHHFLEQWLMENEIDLLISDNRYGLWSKKIRSILITHQLFIKTPVGAQVVHKKIKTLIANFDECWIPDVEGASNLSGDLAHLKPVGLPYRFIGSLSRFGGLSSDNNNPPMEEFDVLAIFSGPEPQRSIFEKVVLSQLQQSNVNAVVLRGLPENEKQVLSGDGKIRLFNHLNTTVLLDYIQKSKVVICRSGYSSIMDLIALKKRAILVPTPGQTEQEYLANYHQRQGNFYSQQQTEFDLKSGMIEVLKYAPTPIVSEPINFAALV